MTEKSDIGEGKLVYSCNYGWIDRSHAVTTGGIGNFVGSRKLWLQLRDSQKLTY